MVAAVRNLSRADVVRCRSGLKKTEFKSYCSVARAFLPLHGNPVFRATRRKYTLIRAEAQSPADEALQLGDEERVRALVLENPAVINRGNECGFSLVVQLCYQGGSASLLKFLLDHGGDAHVLSGSESLTPVAIARGRGHMHLLQHLPANCLYSSLILDSKTLGHLFELSGSITSEDSGLSFSVEGFWFHYWIDLFQNGVKNFEKYSGSLWNRTRVKEILFHLELLKSNCLNLTLCQNFLEDDSAFVLDTGWIGHSIMTLFWRSYLIVCDPSGFGKMPTIKVHKIDPSLITQDVLDTIDWMHENAAHEEGIAYFTQDLPYELGTLSLGLSPQDQEVIEAFSAIAPSPIRMAICSFASLAIAIDVLATVGEVSKRSDRNILSVTKRVSLDSQRLRTYMQGEFLFSYLCRHGKNPDINFGLVKTAYKRVITDLRRKFPHVQDLKFQTASGVISGDGLLDRITKMFLRRGESVHGR